MSIRPVGDSHEWAKFLTLASAAKVRNAGFDIPIAPNNTVAKKDQRAGVAKITDETATGAMYKSAVGKKQKPVLGTRFDAYA